MVKEKKLIDPQYSNNEDFLEFCNKLKKCNTVSDIKVDNISEICAKVSLNINVNLPLRRSKMKIDIREVEPISLLCSINEIDYKAPMVFSGRGDFPSEKLPHTSEINGSSAYICLHRGNMDDWYVEHTVEDFINRIRAWFSDAASGKLIRHGDDFEPMLLHKDFGSAVYNYEKVTEFIEEYWEKNSGKSGFAYTICSFTDEKETNLLSGRNDYPMVQILEIDDKRNLSNIIIRYNKMTVPQKNKNLFMGIVAWSNKSIVNNDYFKLSCMDLNGLYDFNESIGNQFKKALKLLKDKEVKNYFLLISAINRPTKLIGYSKNIELLNFIFKVKKVSKKHETTLEPDGNIFVLNHVEPLNRNLAQKLSVQNSTKNPKILVVGAGAIGSKIITHLAKNGYTNITIVDNDCLSPHNLVRHTLYADSIGKNKASELVSKIEEMYLLETDKRFSAENISFIEYAKSRNLCDYDVLLDFSASKSVFTFLSKFKGPLPKLVVRAEIADDGKLGLMMVEGRNRVPRIDEIQVKMFTEALLNPNISSWLVNYKKLRDQLGDVQLEEVKVGMGCSTNTMKLSDDIISYHASVFAHRIKMILTNEVNNAELFISYFDEHDITNNSFRSILVDEFISIENDTGHEWITKLYKGAYDKIMKELNDASPKETGGILLGNINLKDKIIYVTDMYMPEDSTGTPYLFTKGSEGTKELLEEIISSTGNMLIYVGDWHSHPKSSVAMSKIDSRSLAELRENLANTEFPAHIMIFNETTVSSYIVNQ